jgi:hypothetical protein
MCCVEGCRMQDEGAQQQACSMLDLFNQPTNHLKGINTATVEHSLK